MAGPVRPVRECCVWYVRSELLNGPRSKSEYLQRAASVVEQRFVLMFVALQAAECKREPRVDRARRGAVHLASYQQVAAA